MNKYEILNLSGAINCLKHINLDKKNLEKDLKRLKRFKIFNKIYATILTLTMLGISILSNSILVGIFTTSIISFFPSISILTVYISLPKENEIKNKLIKLEKKEVASKKFIKNFSKLLEKKGYNISADSLIKASIINEKININENNNTTIIRENKTYGMSKKTGKIYSVGHEYKVNGDVIGNDSDVHYVDETRQPIISYSTINNISEKLVLKIGKNNL